jgi:hypothetical protein
MDPRFETTVSLSSRSVVATSKSRLLAESRETDGEKPTGAAA